MLIRRVFVAVVVLATAACTTTPTPETPQSPPSPSSVVSTPPQAVPVSKDDSMVQGIAVYWPDNPADSLATVRAKARRVLDYVVSLGANAVSLSFPFYVDSAQASRVRSGPETPSPRRVAAVVAAAQERDLMVTLRPLLDEANLPEWRGAIEPADPAAWFRSYRDWLTPYLNLAQRMDVARFAIGVELNSLERSPHWGMIVDTARSLYDGTLTFARNWNAFNAYPLPIPVQVEGVDAYFTTDLADSATLDQVVQAWRDYFAAVARPFDYSEVTLTEVGISAQNGAYARPWVFSDPSIPENTLVQKRWFRAACQFATGHDMAGLYYWKLSFHADPARPQVTNTDRGAFLGRPAADVIRDCFTR